MSAHGWPQLSQVYRVSGVEGERPAVVAVTVRQGRTMMRVVGVWGVQGRGPWWPLVPGALAGPGPAAALR